MKASKICAKYCSTDAELKSSIKLLELDRNELGNNREHPSSYDRNMCILQHMLIDDSFENRQSGRPKISDTHIWSKAAEIFKIIACGLTVSVPSIYFEFGTRNVLSWSTMVHPRQIATVPAPASSSKQICYPWITISATAKRGGTVTTNLIRAALA